MIKIDELVHGKWYRNEWIDSTGTNVWYFIFSRLGNNNFIYFKGNYFFSNNRYIINTNENAMFNEDDLFEEITFNFVAQYLSDNHPDKKEYIRTQKIKFLLNEYR